MRCPKCNFDNTIGAKYCRQCGYDFKSEQSIIDKYPEYGFVPISVVRKKPSIIVIVLFILTSLIFLLLFCSILLAIFSGK